MRSARKRMSSIVLVLLFVVSTYKIGDCLQCYECSSRLGFDDFVACRYGKTHYLRKVECIGPSVCATYILTTGNQGYSLASTQGYPSSTVVNRGCQAIRFGSTCEDIFNDLRRRGSVFPGHHECFTCSTDYCNSSAKLPVPVLIISIISLLNSNQYFWL